VASLRELVASPALGPLLGYVSRPRTDRVVRRVALVEDVGDLGRVGEDAIVLLTRSASRAASTYRFDMALRVAHSRRVAALVLAAHDVPRITLTAAALADRTGTALLGTGDDIDLAALAIAIDDELAGGADVALLRAHTALRAIEAHPADGPTDALLERAGAALGAEIRMVATEPDGAGGPRRPVVDQGGNVQAWLVAEPQDGDLAMAVDLVLHAAAASVAEALARAERRRELPARSREEVLTDFLNAAPHARDQLVVRARSLGLPIDGWHVAVRLDFEDLADPSPGDELPAYEARLRVVTEALRGVRATGGSWHGARAGEAFVLVLSDPEDPGAAAAGDVAERMDHVLASLRGRLPSTLTRCGVGTAHPGSAGLLTSVAEAKAATVAGRTSQRATSAVPFDRAGLRTTLLEWYASDTAREAAVSVLEPLSQLGGVRGERLIHTLHVYLDQRGSLTRTAQQLNLHRNAVAYRVTKIFALLDVDQDNPDDLLLLQLACRARELA
jgi:sugar diacid utilization regulator